MYSERKRGDIGDILGSKRCFKNTGLRAFAILRHFAFVCLSYDVTRVLGGGFTTTGTEIRELMESKAIYINGAQI